jgi:hypothetical protein
VPLTNLAGWLLAGLVLMTLLEVAVERTAVPGRRADAAPLLVHRLDGRRRGAGARAVAGPARLGGVGRGALPGRAGGAGAAGPPAVSGPVVRVLSGLAVAGAAHTCVNAVLLRRSPADPPPVARPVTVVVPVRDEEAQVGGLPGRRPRLARRAGPAGGGRRRRLHRRHGGRRPRRRDPRVRLVPAGDPPEGWLGKPHACWVGAQTLTEDGYLVFVDADVRLSPRAVASAVALLDAHGLDLVSPWPRPVAGTLPSGWCSPVAVAVADHAAPAGRRALAAARR